MTSCAPATGTSIDRDADVAEFLTYGDGVVTRRLYRGHWRRLPYGAKCGGGRMLRPMRRTHALDAPALLIYQDRHILSPGQIAKTCR